jgi:hypothetical protein
MYVYSCIHTYGVSLSELFSRFTCSEWSICFKGEFYRYMHRHTLTYILACVHIVLHAASGQSLSRVSLTYVHTYIHNHYFNHCLFSVLSEVAFLHDHINIYIYACMHACMQYIHTCMHAYIHVHITHIYKRLTPYFYFQLCLRPKFCMIIYIHAWIHASRHHTHTYMYTLHKWVLFSALSEVTFWNDHIHTYTHTHTCIHCTHGFFVLQSMGVRDHKHTYIHTNIHTYACSHIIVHNHIHTCIHTYIGACLVLSYWLMS